MRGWMFNWPGVAMNSPTLPSPTISTIRSPMASRIVEVLAGVGHARVGGAGVVGHDGDPASSAACTGSLNASRSTSDTAIPLAPPAIAASKVSTIWPMSELSEPVH